MPPSARRRSRRTSDLARALKIVQCEYGSPAATRRLRIRGVPRFGELFLFSEAEHKHLTALRDLIERYVAQQQQPRPLCLAVFGPPGSGKSFAVKQILKQVEKASKAKLTRTDVNLTQVADSRALASLLAHAGRPTDGSTPVVFFDEFDAQKDGAPFGWLSWFLAPMQDGEFVADGNVVQVKRAVYVFAGGTAATQKQFSDFDRLPQFQRAKGPDFVSRLRGFLDVCGPNEEPRLLRRAILLHSELSSRVRRNGAGKCRPDRDVMEALLQVGRYRHGARSIAAVVELSHVSAKKRRLQWKDLPRNHLLELHIDRGPLDPRSIGGAIALSGYGPAEIVEDFWCSIARRLWNEGAKLAYAGRWAEGTGGWLMKFLQQELQRRPPEPSRDAYYRANPDPWLEGFLNDTREERARVEKAIPLKRRKQLGVSVTFADHLTADETGRLDRWLRSGLEHFRRRLAVADISVARFAIAGATEGYYGRFPGVPEEIMLTLAQGRPVYISGALGGAAADIGSLLGLSHPRTGALPTWLKAEPLQNERSLQTISSELRPGPWTDLPITAADLASFLKAHAIGGAKWPDNGLSLADNRRLFASRDPSEVGDLVMKGLLRRFSKATRAPIDQ
jgi:SLOG-like protein/ATPase family protein associated with various cellular activities (AAA)